jgi:hypothetical protein
MAAIGAQSIKNSNIVSDNAAREIMGVDEDVDQAGSKPPQARFGDQSSRLPRRKIVTVSFDFFIVCGTCFELSLPKLRMRSVPSPGASKHNEGIVVIGRAFGRRRR